MLFAATALFAAEPNPTAPTPTTNTVPALQVDLAEQARLVAEIGTEAAKGFDTETYARSLRAQIEALLSKPAPPKPDVKTEAADNTTPPAVPATKAPDLTAPAARPAPAKTSVTGPDRAALKEAVRILRAEADRLEAQLEKLPPQR